MSVLKRFNVFAQYPVETPRGPHGPSWKNNWTLWFRSVFSFVRSDLTDTSKVNPTKWCQRQQPNAGIPKCLVSEKLSCKNVYKRHFRSSSNNYRCCALRGLRCSSCCDTVVNIIQNKLDFVEEEAEVFSALKTASILELFSWKGTKIHPNANFHPNLYYFYPAQATTL